MSIDNQRLKRLFEDALALPAAERAMFVERSCGNDAELREELERLVAAHESAGDFLEPPAVQPEADLGSAASGTVIGRYKLLQEIGEGGFGRVFMAEQTQPVQRRVALKIIKAGMDTREVLARFEAERQALALMDHPNIARVLDAGTTETGRPYFVMELIRGIPITDYCDQEQLVPEARLGLFMQVCHAVQHAHQKGIIHRDLKPTNILVTLIDGEPVPKVIDFGVVKALGQRLTEKTLFTRFEEFLGTPAYMSPEQAALSGVDIDTRSDIYALGVLLYELLTGVTPFDEQTLREAALDEVRRIIREVEPLKPSNRLRTLGDKLTVVAQRRHTEAAALPRLLDGDLDWVVMKCLEKERGRRYETAGNLAEDIQRHLGHEPVLASPPSVVYRLRKFVRRNRVAVAVSAVVVVAVALGLAAAVAGLGRAHRAREAEARQRDRAEELSKTADLLRYKAQSSEKEVRRLAGRRSWAESAYNRAVERYPGDPVLWTAKGLWLTEHGRLPEANQALRRALALVEADANAHRALRDDLAAAFGRLALALRNQGKSTEAAATLRQAGNLGFDFPTQVNATVAMINRANSKRILKERLTRERQATVVDETRYQEELRLLAYAYIDEKNYVEGESVLRDLLNSQTNSVTPGKELAETHSLMALALLLQDKEAESKGHLRQALAIVRDTSDKASLEEILEYYGVVLANNKKQYAEAEPLFSEVLEIRKTLLGANHPARVRAARNLTIIFMLQGEKLCRDRKWREAAEMYHRALPLLASDQPTSAAWLPDGSVWIGIAFLRAGDTAGHRLFCQTLATTLDQFPSPGDMAMQTARVCLLPSKPGPDLATLASNLLVRAESISQKTNTLNRFYLDRGMMEYRSGQYAKALETLGATAFSSDDYYPGVGALLFQALAAKRLGRDQDATRLYQHFRLMLPEKAPLPESKISFLDAQVLEFHLEEAEPLIPEAAKLRKELFQTELSSHVGSADSPAAVLLRQGEQLERDRKWEEAAETYRQVLPLLLSDLPEADAPLHNNMLAIGLAFVRAGDFASHRWFCQALATNLDQFSSPVDMARRTAGICLYPFDPGPELVTLASNLLVRARPASPRAASFNWYRGYRGKMEYRSGQYAKAMETLGTMAAAAPEAYPRVTALIFQALAAKRLGRDREAAQLYQHLKRTLPGIKALPNFAVNCLDVQFLEFYLEEAERLFPEAAELREWLLETNRPTSVGSTYSLGVVLLQHGQKLSRDKKWQEAAETYRRALPLLLSDQSKAVGVLHNTMFEIGFTFVRAGDFASHRRFCQTLATNLDQFSSPQHIARRTARVCLFPSEPGPDLITLASNLLVRAEPASQRANTINWFNLYWGRMEYRSGQYDKALQTLGAVAAVALESYPRASALLFQAQAAKRLGHDQEADRCYQHFKRILEESKALPGFAISPLETQIIEYHQAEAERLLNPSESLPAPDS